LYLQFPSTDVPTIELICTYLSYMGAGVPAGWGGYISSG
jgi:hypothetical protein